MRLGKKPLKVRIEDYEEIQGYMPEVRIREKISEVIHPTTEGNNIVARTHGDPNRYAEVEMQTSRGTRSFNSYLLRQFHRNPVVVC